MSGGHVVCIRNVVVGAPLAENYNLPAHYTFADNSWSQSFYHVYNYRAVYQDAKSKCESDGAVLATPKSSDESKFLKEISAKKFVYYGHNAPAFWIGIDDLLIPDKLTYADGNSPIYTNWHHGYQQPKINSLYQEAVIAWVGDWSWIVRRIDEGYRFICIRNVIIPTEAPTTTSTIIDVSSTVELTTAVSISTNHGKIYVPDDGS